MTNPPPAPDALADPRRTWRIADDRRLPTLEPYSDDVHRSEPVTVRETVWDTDDRVLAFAGVELLHDENVGADDAGWSIDRGQGPVVPTDPDGAGARDAVEVLLRGRPIGAVRVRDTSTTLVVLRGRDGRVRAEVADVRIDEGDPDTALLASGRWWALSDDGAPGTIARSVERALADAADDPGRGITGPVPRLAPVRRPAHPRVDLPRRGSAAAFVRDTLIGLRADLVAVDPRVRADEHESVHAFRKVLRRLRSVLVAFRGALDGDATESLRDQLAVVGRLAGTARDAEVLAGRLPRAAARAPEGFVDADTLDHIGGVVGAARTASAAALRRALRTTVWFGALDALDQLIETAPAGEHADDDAAAFTTKRIGRERARLRRTIDRAGDDLESVHAIRKAARRLRYAVQAAGGLPDVGKRRLGRLRRIQDALGEALDAAHAADALRRIAADAAAAGVDTFGHGVLAAGERSLLDRRIARGRRLLAGL